MEDSLKMLMAPPPGRGSVGCGESAAWSASPRAPAPPRGGGSRRWGPAGTGSPPPGAGWRGPGPCSSPSGSPNPWREGDARGEVHIQWPHRGAPDGSAAEASWRSPMCPTFRLPWLVADCPQRDSGLRLLIAPLGIKKWTEMFQTHWSDDVRQFWVLESKTNWKWKYFES